MKNAKKLLRIVSLSLIFGAALYSCGGESTTTTEGTVIDGYLKDAKVCVDKNLNGKCDDGEPSTYTDGNGKYVLYEDVGSYPVVAELIKGKTSDVTLNETVDDNSTLVSIPGESRIITPFTTICAGLIKAGEDPERAQKSVQEMFGVNPIEDYIKENNVTAAAKAYVLTRVMADLGVDPKNFAISFLVNSTILDTINSTAEKISSLEDIPVSTEQALCSIETGFEDAVKEAKITEFNLLSFTVNSTDISAKLNDLLNNLNNIINNGNVTVLTVNGKYDCSITGKAITNGVDITIKCPTFYINATSSPVFSTENMFAAAVENASDSSLIGTPVVVTTSYYGSYVAQFLDGTYKNYRVNATNENNWNWQKGKTTYKYNSQNKTLTACNEDECYYFTYSLDTATGKISGSDTEHGLQLVLFPILKDTNGNILTLYRTTKDGKLASQNVEILLKQ